ncbi:MAG: efflux RND transporter permease subunit, partial [Bacillota bacterium]|nr:efflux RND transporter permease subunit [Bacillota bacterium]
MIKQSVKKPFTVLVAVIMVIALGVVSLTKMTADLLPQISLPYLMVITTYPGASPEKVEQDVTVPLESALGTVNGVKTVSSTSAENYSMVSLEFEDETDMDSALVKVFSALDPVEATLPDDVGTPSVLEISADMLATAYIGFQYDGMDIYDLTNYAKDELVPAIERVDGVASVTTMGLVEKTVHIELNQEKVDKLNYKILAKADKAFADALVDLNEAKEKLDEAQEKLDDARADLPDQIKEYYDSVEEFEDGKEEVADALDEIED